MILHFKPLSGLSNCSDKSYKQIFDYTNTHGISYVKDTDFIDGFLKSSLTGFNASTGISTGTGLSAQTWLDCWHRKVQGPGHHSPR